MILTSAFRNPIPEEVRECMSVECGQLFVMDKVPCEMIRVQWCIIFLMAHV
jgi:hypothetical protein